MEKSWEFVSLGIKKEGEATITIQGNEADLACRFPCNHYSYLTCFERYNEMGNFSGKGK